MKRQKKTFIFICMIFCFGLLFHQPVKAAQMELLPEQSGLLMEEESQSFPFYVPVKANVTIAFVGLNDDDDGTYGCYILGIRDIRNEYVFTQRGEIEYDNKKITTILEPGAYSLDLLCDDLDFEYVFSIRATPFSQIATESLKRKKKSVSLEKGKACQLKASCKPYYATDSESWKSSRPKVASVNREGKVTAKSLGQTVITVKKGGLTASCTVTVNSTYIEANKGQTKDLTALLKNVKGYKKASFSSGAKSIANISSGRKLKCFKHGQTKLTVRISGKKYMIKVYVYDHAVLEQKAKSKLRSLLRVPGSLIINKITGSGNFISIDYSAMNGYGGYSRGRFTAWYEKGRMVYIAR